MAFVCQHVLSLLVILSAQSSMLQSMAALRCSTGGSQTAHNNQAHWEFNARRCIALHCTSVGYKTQQLCQAALQAAYQRQALSGHLCLDAAYEAIRLVGRDDTAP